MGSGNESLTKMAARSIYGQNPLKIFSETSGLVSTKLGIGDSGQS